MAKTRISQEKRELVAEHMLATWDAANQPDSAATEKLRVKLVGIVNKIIAKRYPTADMEVLKKYRLTRQDSCLRFAEEGGTIVGVDLRGAHAGENDDRGLLEIPARSGCGYRDGGSSYMPCGADLRPAVEAWEKSKNDHVNTRREKEREYWAFLVACNTVEDVEEVVPLPSVLRERLTGQRAALVAVSEERIASLKAEFAPKPAKRK